MLKEDKESLSGIDAVARKDARLADKRELTYFAKDNF